MSEVEEVTRITFHHVVAKLSDQQSYLIALRNQAGISAAVSGIIATLFGTIIGEHSEVYSGDAFLGYSIMALMAIACLGGSVACSAMVVVHYYNFTFSFDGKRMLEEIDNSESPAAFYRRYISDAEWYFLDNESMISDLQRKLWFAMVLGFAQILPWLALISQVKHE